MNKMNKYLLLFGVVLLSIIALVIFYFKRSNLLIDGPDGIENNKIISMSKNGTLLLTDNTVTNMNDYLGSVVTTLNNKINDAKAAADVNAKNYVDANKTALTTLINTKQDKGEYIKYEDKLMMATIGDDWAWLVAEPPGGRIRIADNMSDFKGRRKLVTKDRPQAQLGFIFYKHGQDDLRDWTRSAA